MLVIDNDIDDWNGGRGDDQDLNFQQLSHSLTNGLDRDNRKAGMRNRLLSVLNLIF